MTEKKPSWSHDHGEDPPLTYWSDSSDDSDWERVDPTVDNAKEPSDQKVEEVKLSTQSVGRDTAESDDLGIKPKSSDASNPVVDPAPAVNSVEESLKNLRVSQPPEHFHSLEINTTPQNPDVVTLLWSVEGRKDSKVCFVSDRTFGAKPQFKGEDHTRDAVIFFMGPFDKPNNTFDSITINVLTGDDREVEKVGYEKCIRMLEFISERLSLLEHQIHVKHFIMTFDNFHQVTAILKHLKPKVLKKMTLKATPPLFDYPSVPSEIDQLMDLDQFKLAKHLVASNFSVPLERSAHFGDLQCTAPAIDKAQFDSIIQNVLKPGGWASRIFWSSDGALYRYLKDYTQRKFNVKLEDGEQEWVDGIYSVTFAGESNECTIMYRKDGHPGKVHFINRELLMWWPNSLERPDEEVHEKLSEQQSDLISDRGDQPNRQDLEPNRGSLSSQDHQVQNDRYQSSDNVDNHRNHHQKTEADDWSEVWKAFQSDQPYLPQCNLFDWRRYLASRYQRPSDNQQRNDRDLLQSNLSNRTSRFGSRREQFGAPRRHNRAHLYELGRQFAEDVYQQNGRFDEFQDYEPFGRRLQTDRYHYQQGSSSYRRAETYCRPDDHMGLSFQQFLELEKHYNRYHGGSGNQCRYQSGNEAPSNRNYERDHHNQGSSSGQHSDRRCSSNAASEQEGRYRKDYQRRD